MGETVESYRMALESEISGWNGFVRALRKEDREAFGELKEMCCNNAMALVMFVKFQVYCTVLLFLR